VNLLVLMSAILLVGGLLATLGWYGYREAGHMLPIAVTAQIHRSR